MPIKINGKTYNPKQVRLDLVNARRETLSDAADLIEEDLNKLVKNLQRRSQRKAFGDAKVVRRENSDGSIEIFVRGYIFNLLDQGRPAIVKAKPMRFPVYGSTLTRPNSATLQRERVERGPAFVFTKRVKAVKARNFIQQIAKKHRLTKHSRKTNRYGLTVRFDPTELIIKVEDR